VLTDWVARSCPVSPASLRFALVHAGFTTADIGPFENRYPLGYWARLAPIPRLLKRALSGGAGRLTLNASVGNLIAWAGA